MSSAETIYLVSGSARGIGYELVASLAARPNTLVFAGVRDTTKTPALDALTLRFPGQVEIIQLISASEEDNKIAAAIIEKKAGRLDVVIANAGISNFRGPLEQTPAQEMRDHFEINALGPLILYQSMAPLLKKSTNPHFSVISSVAGSIGDYFHLGSAPYGSSKAAANFIVKAIHHENKDIIVTAIHPGWVQTDLGNRGAVKNGLPEAPVTTRDSVDGILRHIDGATREEKSGKFWNFKATSGKPWDKNTEELVW